jgi:hypothetical protein
MILMNKQLLVLKPDTPQAEVDKFVQHVFYESAKFRGEVK